MIFSNGQVPRGSDNQPAGKGRRALSALDRIYLGAIPISSGLGSAKQREPFTRSIDCWLNLCNIGIMSFGVPISYFRRRRWILLALCTITPLGLLLWFYDGPGRRWFNFYLTCSAYEIFWCLVVFFFWPRKKNAAPIASAVLAATCVLEVLQLWRPPFLQQIRSTFLGMAIIGTDFVWRQFPYYVAGSGIGWLLMRWIGNRAV